MTADLNALAKKLLRGVEVPSSRGRRRWHRQIRVSFMERTFIGSAGVAPILNPLTPSVSDVAASKDKAAQSLPLETDISIEDLYRFIDPDLEDDQAVAESIKTLNDLLTTTPPISSFVPHGLVWSQAPAYDVIKLNGQMLVFNLPKPYMEFSIDLSNTESGNSGTLSIWNLEDDQVSAIETSHAVVIEAGHRDAPPMQRVFVGRVDHVESRESGSDRVTTITLTSSGNQYMTNRALYTAPPHVSATAVLSALSMQFAQSTNGIGIRLGQLQVGKDIEFRRGVHFQTNMSLRRAIAEIADAAEAKSFEVDGELIIQPRAPGSRVVDVSLTKDGWYRIIGRPERVKENSDADADSGAWTITTFLDSVFRPGVTVRVNSDEFKGLLEITEAQRVADRDRFYSIIKGTHVTGIINPVSEQEALENPTPEPVPTS